MKRTNICRIRQNKHTVSDPLIANYSNISKTLLALIKTIVESVLKERQADGLASHARKRTNLSSRNVMLFCLMKMGGSTDRPRLSPFSMREFQFAHHFSFSSPFVLTSFPSLFLSLRGHGKNKSRTIEIFKMGLLFIMAFDLAPRSLSLKCSCQVGIH